ncbi:MAG: putative sulfate exporter family transporter, partial [Lentisphaeria bacterium]|nr:putative sulfate exporter family transporter [Lentisphaeria bacterium]
MLLGRFFRIPRNASCLVSVGTSICGGSAIAAAAPVLKAQSHEIAMASATVFTLNAIALWVFPAVGNALGFTQEQFGYWAALGIHDTSSVVGASMAYGETALEVGTTVKLARALWIVPVTMFLAWIFGDNTGEGKGKFKLKVPWFIPGFLLAAALVTYVPQWIPSTAEAAACAGGFLKNISKYLMIVTLFLIGANLNRAKLKELGLKPVLQGLILWILLAALWCCAIHWNWIRCVR